MADTVNLENLTLKVGASGESGAVAGLDMNSEVLPNLADGVAATDGTNKLQVESLIAASAIPVIDNLTSTSLTSALSANQGRVLNAAQTGTVKSINNIIDATSSEMTSLLPGTANSSATNVGQVDAKIAAAIPPLSSPTPSIIWAEISGALNPTDKSGFQWSFGSGAKSPIGSGILITEPVDIVSMFVSADPVASTGTAIIRLYKNGAPVSAGLIGTFVNVTANSSNNYQGIENIFPPVSLTRGDSINFKTETVTGVVSNARVGITCIGAGVNLLTNMLNAKPISLVAAKEKEYKEGEIVFIKEVVRAPLTHKFANGFFQAVTYSEIPGFLTEDIPQFAYHITNASLAPKVTFLININSIGSESFCFTNETEITTLIPFFNDCGQPLFNQELQEMCIIVAGSIEYLATKNEVDENTLNNVPITLADAKDRTFEDSELVYLNAPAHAGVKIKNGLYEAWTTDVPYTTLPDIKGLRYSVLKNGDLYVYLYNVSVRFETALRYHPIYSPIIENFSILANSGAMLYNTADHKHTVIINSPESPPVKIARDIAYSVQYDNAAAITALEISRLNNTGQIVYNRDLNSSGLVRNGVVQYFAFGK